MKISFDFDETLDRDDVQEFAKELILAGHELHIVTSRSNSEGLIWKGWNNDLFKVIDSLKIPRENIHFVNFEDKYLFFQRNPGFVFHLDDSWMEVDFINKYKPTTGVNVTRQGWKEECQKLINAV